MSHFNIKCLIQLKANTFIKQQFKKVLMRDKNFGISEDEWENIDLGDFLEAMYDSQYETVKKTFKNYNSLEVEDAFWKTYFYFKKRFEHGPELKYDRLNHLFVQGLRRNIFKEIKNNSSTVSVDTFVEGAFQIVSEDFLEEVKDKEKDFLATHKAMKRLCKQCQKLFDLRFWKNKTYEYVAKRLGISEASARQKFSRKCGPSFRDFFLEERSKLDDYLIAV